MKSRILKSAALAAACTVSVAANASLLTNGGFEEPNQNGGWSLYSNIPGWSGSTVEIWADPFGPGAYEGDQYAELNSGGAAPFTLFQDFDTVLNQTYNFSFAYRARINDLESFSFRIDDIVGTGIDAQITEVVSTTVIDDHTTSAWSVFNGSFVAQGSTSRIAFQTIYPDQSGACGGTCGNLLDGVVVEGAVAVSEPGSLALLGLGLAGLGFTRRRASK